MSGHLVPASETCLEIDEAATGIHEELPMYMSCVNEPNPTSAEDTIEFTWAPVKTCHNYKGVRRIAEKIGEDETIRIPDELTCVAILG